MRRLLQSWALFGATRAENARRSRRRARRVPPSYRPGVEALEERTVLSPVQFSASAYSVNENVGQAVITVTRGSSSGTETVQYAATSGSAVAASPTPGPGGDYFAATGTLTFSPGQTSRTFTVNILEDAIEDDGETINLALSNPGGGTTLGSPSTAVLTLIDNFGFDPSARAQEALELINRMRLMPAAELPILLASTDPNITGALSFFNVNLTVLTQQWDALNPVAPLAWHPALYDAAVGHSLQMLQYDSQSHQLPGEPALGPRVTNAGYTWNALGENVFAFATSMFQDHAAFVIDWGFTPTGIQTPPGHRNSIMNSLYREVGIGVLNDLPSNVTTGPLLVTQDFGNRPSFGNAYVLGVVYNDSNGNGHYEAGEGLGDVNVTLTGGGSFNLMTTSSGQYQAQVPAGSYTATFSGGGLPSPVTRTVTIGSATTNVKVDVEADQVWWDGGGGNFDWSNPLNWSTNSLPGPGSDVVIDVPGGTSLTITHSSGTTTIKSLTSQASLVLSGGSFSVSSPSFITAGLTLSGGTLTGAGHLTVNGPLTWTSGTMSGIGQTFAQGGVSISGAGTKQLNRTLVNLGTGTITGAALSGTGTLRNGAGKTLTVSGGTLSTTSVNHGSLVNQGNSTISGTISGEGTLTQAGTGTLTLSGANTYTGATSVNAGTLLLTGSITSAVTVNGGATLRGTGSITGDVSNSGTVSPGVAGAGTLTIVGNYTQTTTGTLSIEIGGLTAGSQFDRLAVSGGAGLDGTLSVSLINGFIPSVGDPFAALTYGAGGGDFAVRNGVSLGGGLVLGHLVDATEFRLVAQSLTGRIIDSGDPGFSTTGAWSTYVGPEVFQFDVHFLPPGGGANTAVWTFNNLAPGQYRVSATWFPISLAATDALYVVSGGASPQMVAVNQESAPSSFSDAGAMWHDLAASYTITGSTLTVTLSDLANDYVEADAVRIERVGNQVSIIDSGNTGFNVVGPWLTYNGPEVFQGDLHFIQSGGGGSTATWTFTGLAPGQYRISATWFAHPLGATNATFTILDDATPLGTTAVNQELAPNDFGDAGTSWEDLGFFTITSGTLVVQLSDLANDYVMADAIRIERLEFPV